MKRGSKLFFCLVTMSCMFSFVLGVKAESYKTYTIGQEIKFNPITGEYCKSGNNCKTFNVINTGGDTEYYEMQLNYNLIANSTWGDIQNGPTVAVAELKEATKNWKGIETYTSNDNVELPSSAGSYIVNYNGSKARMITADEVASLYSYQTVSGNKWVWNGLGTSNNIKFTKTNQWLAQNLGDRIYSDTSTYGHVYDDVETESGHFPFNYFTASATIFQNIYSEIKDGVYTVESSRLALDKTTINYDYGNYDTGLRPIVKLRKELQETSNIQTKEVLITGSKVEPNNVIPSLNEIQIPFDLKVNDYFWFEKCGENNYKEVLPGKKFTEGCTYDLYIDFDTSDVNNKYNENVDITSDEIIFKYNGNSSYETDYSYDEQLTYAKFKFECIKNETSDNIDKPTSDSEVNVDKPASDSEVNIDKPTSDSEVNVDKPTSDSEVNIDKPTSDSEVNVDKPTSDNNIEKPSLEEELTNPKTNDSIYNSLMLMLLSGISLCILFKIKFKKSN